MRLGVFDQEAGSLVVIGDHPTVVRHGADGSAHCSFSACWSAVEDLLGELGRYLVGRPVAGIRLAVTGQVSSLISWVDGEKQPLQDSFPIWLDTTCKAALPELVQLWEGDGARTILGTCMPAATNWLAVKIRHARAQAGAQATAAAGHVRYVQLQDAVVLLLTGVLMSHPSTQISLVDHRTLAYAPRMLEFLCLSPEQLPAINAAGQAPLAHGLAARWGLPPTAVHVAPQDSHAALLGLCPDAGDGLLLAGTSEIIGICEGHARPQSPSRMVRAQLGPSWIIYGSTASGGATLDWLMRNVLRRTAPDALDALTSQAEVIAPGCEGLLCSFRSYLSLASARPCGTPISAPPSSACARTMAMPICCAPCWRAWPSPAARAPRPSRNAPCRSRFLCAGGGTRNGLWNRHPRLSLRAGRWRS